MMINLERLRSKLITCALRALVADFGSAKQFQKHRTLAVRSTANPHFEKMKFFQNDVSILLRSGYLKMQKKWLVKLNSSKKNLV